MDIPSWDSQFTMDKIVIVISRELQFTVFHSFTWFVIAQRGMSVDEQNHVSVCCRFKEKGKRHLLGHPELFLSLFLIWSMNVSVLRLMIGAGKYPCTYWSNNISSFLTRWSSLQEATSSSYILCPCCSKVQQNCLQAPKQMCIYFCLSEFSSTSDCTGESQPWAKDHHSSYTLPTSQISSMERDFTKLTPTF